MDLKQLFADDDAVSPVIGVILMVAITVILAAVIASFVLGLGNQTGTGAPTTTIGFDYEQTESGNSGQKAWGILEVSHDGGDSIKYQELYLRGSGFNATSGRCSPSAADPDWARDGSSGGCSVSNADGGTNFNGESSAEAYVGTLSETVHVASAGEWPAARTSGDDSKVVSGDTVNVYVSGDYEISVVYQSQEGDTSSTLNEQSGPDA